MARIVYTDSSNREHSVYLGPDQPVVSIGRATDCSIRSNRKSVSRHHAEFRYNNGTFEVIDLNSSNGTWLIENEQRFEITHERLEDQDEIWCGDFIVHFLLDDPVDHEVTVNNQHPSGEQQYGGDQQYVSGPTEAADAFAFGAEASEVQHGAHGGLEQPSSVNFDYEEVEELGEADFVEVDEVSPSGGHDAYSGENYGGDTYGGENFGGENYGGDIERLMREKQSIEDLASRQAFEIEELQAELQAASQQLEQMQAQDAGIEQLQADLDAARNDVEALRQENQQLLQQLDSGSQNAAEVERLSAELDQERHQVEQLRSETQRTEDELSGVRRRLSQTEDRSAELERELAAKTDRVEALEHDVRTLEGELAKTSGSGDEVERMRGQLDEVRGELDKSNRLLDEYERRNADLRAELDERREAAEENEKKLAELFDTRDELQRQLAQVEPMREELAQKSEALEEAEGRAGDLKAEVQGLKQRLQLERRRSSEDDSAELERMEAELVEATERIAELEQERDELNAELDEAAQEEDAGHGIAPEELAELRQRLSALERLADAIDRTDLEPLSTVDRIRLQSAIRETNPKKTLQEALELLE